MKWEEALELARRANDHYSMSEEQQRMCWELAGGVGPGGIIVELGVCRGKTAIVLALAAAQQKAWYVGIDNWSLEGSELEVKDLLAALPIPRAAWQLYKEDTHNELWKAWQPEGIDFLLIDAGHDRSNVFPDCEIWIPKVKPGGAVIWDDVPSGKGWGESAHWAVRETVEYWAGEWEHAAEFGKTWARRKPMDAV